MTQDLGAAKSRRARFPAVALSLAGHAAVLLALVSVRIAPPKPPEPPPVEAELLDALPLQAPTPKSEPAEAKPAAQAPTPSKRPPQHSLARPVKARRPAALAAEKEPAEAAAPGLSEADLAGAATSQSGGRGAGACNMARMLEAALRKDNLVQAAVSTAAGRALLVWRDGDWVRTGGEDGKGLSAVREAMIWEIGFAPAACRTEPVHGMVVIAMGDAPGSTRLAVGGGEWRWSDLLNSRRGAIADR